jgi:hypothetical protein
MPAEKWSRLLDSQYESDALPSCIAITIFIRLDELECE